MSILDLLYTAFGNLWRTRIRTFLTVLGVMVGIGALISMVSFGTGLEKNITDVFQSNDLFTSLTVTASKISLQNPSSMMEESGRSTVPLNDSVIALIKKVDGVEMAYPEISTPVRVMYGSKSTTRNLMGMPAQMRNYKPYDELLAGKFFTSDSAKEVIVSTELLQKLGVYLKTEKASEYDTLKAKRVAPESLIGKKIKIVTASMSQMSMNPMAMMMGMGGSSPVAQTEFEFVIGGIMKSERFSGRNLGGDIIAPLHSAQKLPSLGFTNVMELLNRGSTKSKYSSVYVRVKEVKDAEPVRKQLEKMKLNIFSFADQLQEIKRGFLVIDSILGVIGIISLLVAALGIINTMLMSILERTREIGIMKAIGGSELQIRIIFFFEAGCIGLLGALGGIGLGWIVTRIANVIVNIQASQQGQDPIELFYFPVWLIVGSIVFSIGISLLAGLYPAIRASRVDPVEALRHD